MLNQVLVASALMLVTSMVHAGAMSIGLRLLAIVHRKRAFVSTIVRRSFIVGVLVQIMFVATVIEATIWAFTYTSLDASANFEQALYFSTVTYTTLGFGDVVLGEQWRLLSSFQAVNGVIMFGWTTAVIVFAIRDISKSVSELRDPH